MKRIPFSQVLKNASIDIRREYDHLYGFFYLQKWQMVLGIMFLCATHVQRISSDFHSVELVSHWMILMISMDTLLPISSLSSFVYFIFNLMYSVPACCSYFCLVCIILYHILYRL